MRPMPTLMTTWDASSRLGVPMMPATLVAGGAATTAGPSDAVTLARGPQWVPKCVAPLLGEATVKIGRAEQHERDEEGQSRVHPARGGRPRHRHGARRCSQWEPVHEEHGEAHHRVDRRVRDVQAPCLDGLDRPDDEPDEEAGEDQLPGHVGTERPCRDEHPAHGHAHEHVGQLHVAAPRAALDGRRHQQRQAVQRDREHQDDRRGSTARPALPTMVPLTPLPSVRRRRR